MQALPREQYSALDPGRQRAPSARLKRSHSTAAVASAVLSC